MLTHTVWGVAKRQKADRHTLLRGHRRKRSSQRDPATTKERIPVGRNETALQPYSHSQPLRAHSGIVLKINIFHVEKSRSPYPASRAQAQKKLAAEPGNNKGKNPRRYRNETALQPYSHSQPLRAHSGIVLKINVFHVEKSRSPYPASRAQAQKKLAMTGGSVTASPGPAEKANLHMRKGVAVCSIKRSLVQRCKPGTTAVFVS